MRLPRSRVLNFIAAATCTLVLFTTRNSVSDEAPLWQTHLQSLKPLENQFAFFIFHQIQQPNFTSEDFVPLLAAIASQFSADNDFYEFLAALLSSDKVEVGGKKLIADWPAFLSQSSFGFGKYAAPNSRIYAELDLKQIRTLVDNLSFGFLRAKTWNDQGLRIMTSLLFKPISEDGVFAIYWALINEADYRGARSYLRRMAGPGSALQNRIVAQLKWALSQDHKLKYLDGEYLGPILQGMELSSSVRRDLVRLIFNKLPAAMAKDTVDFSAYSPSLLNFWLELVRPGDLSERQVEFLLKLANEKEGLGRYSAYAVRILARSHHPQTPSLALKIIRAAEQQGLYEVSNAALLSVSVDWPLQRTADEYLPIFNLVQQSRFNLINTFADAGAVDRFGIRHNQNIISPLEEDFFRALFSSSKIEDVHVALATAERRHYTLSASDQDRLRKLLVENGGAWAKGILNGWGHEKAADYNKFLKRNGITETIESMVAMAEILTNTATPAVGSDGCGPRLPRSLH